MDVTYCLTNIIKEKFDEDILLLCLKMLSILSFSMNAAFLLLCVSVCGHCGKMKLGVRRTSGQHHNHGT